MASLLGSWTGRIQDRGGSLPRAKMKDLLVRVKTKLVFMEKKTPFDRLGSKSEREQVSSLVVLNPAQQEYGCVPGN